MGVCCVEGCEVTAEETFYFEFPTSRLLRRKWLEVIPIAGKLPLGTVVCSRHFTSDDYENVRGKVRLKRKVVPSLLLQETLQLQKTTTPNTNSPSPSPPKSPKSPLKESLSPPRSPKSQKPPKSPSSPSPPKSPKSPSPPKSPKSPSPPKSASSPSPPKSPSSPSPPKSQSPPKESDNCDSTTVSIPSPVDAEKMIDDIQNARRKSIPRVTPKDLMAVENGWDSDGKRLEPVPDPKEDIEDMITNYHIKNKVPNPALLADLLPEVPEQLPQDETIEIDDKEAAPVFIEISVDQDTNVPGAGSQDCLMLLESVQVEVDPTTLMLDHEDYEQDDEQEDKAPDKKSDPISLLTSSDEDDVIIQEPHIDTVDVSDETDEDDVPLVKLVKNKSLNKKPAKKKKKTRDEINKIMWGMYDNVFYCMKCHFTTTNSTEYNKHVAEHCKSTVLQVCPICGFTTASKSMFSLHKRVHKVEKKFKCHLCDYWARHKMSLVYHLKNHETNRKPLKVQELRCWKCGFKSKVRSEIMEHIRVCCPGVKRHKCDVCDYSSKRRCEVTRHMKYKHRASKQAECLDGEFHEVEVVDVTKCIDKRYQCNKCDYSSNRRSDMRRHKSRRHQEVSDEDDCVAED